jgi:hypothetical protein
MVFLFFFNRESRRKTPVIVAIKGKDREFGEAAISRVGIIYIYFFRLKQYFLDLVKQNSRTILYVFTRISRKIIK